MEDQFLYAELIPSIILIIIALFCAEFVGRSKHIGFWFTFFMMLGIIPGIIGLITSPSANEKPIKRNKLQDYIAILIWCIGVFYLGFNFAYDKGSWIIIIISISIFSTARYFHKLNFK